MFSKELLEKLKDEAFEKHLCYLIIIDDGKLIDTDCVYRKNSRMEKLLNSVDKIVNKMKPGKRYSEQ